MLILRNVVRCTKAALCVATSRATTSAALERYSLPRTSYHCLRAFSVGTRLLQDVNVTFLRANGEKITTKGKVGDTLLDVVVNNNIDLDGFGACEGTLTCSTCHLIFNPDDYEKLADKPGDEELDMLDLAYDLTDTSRLGCQITLTKEMDGLVVRVPATINDARAA